MNAPKPLTATPPAQIKWSEDGAPVAQDFDDIYFSVDGGLDETKAVFLQGCGLPKAWSEQTIFTIAELGFGSGLNFLATWELWEQTAKPGQRLHFLSIEAFPLSKVQLIRALEKFPSLAAWAEQLIPMWPDRVRGVHRLHFGSVTLTLFHTDIDRALSGMDAQTNILVNAWFLDGFSPVKNPDMWSDAVFAHMARLSAPHARAATFTVAGHVRSGLMDAGFRVEKKPGFGRKRERLEAVYPRNVTNVTTKPVIDIPIIIGAGIAGASIAHSFARRDITPIVIDPSGRGTSDTAASGNPAGLMMPKLDLQDRPESRFYNAAYLYAHNTYMDLYHGHGKVLDEGVLHMATSEKEAARFKKIANNQALPQGEMRSVSHEEAQEIIGHKLTTNYGGLYFPHALAISPRLSTEWLGECAQHIRASVHHIEAVGDQWQVIDDTGKTLATTNALFICNGANIRDLWPLDVRFTRGQICWGATSHTPKCALIAGNYAVPFAGGLLLGATHDHVGAGEIAPIIDADNTEIQSLYTEATGQKIDAENWQSRAAVRVTTRNTLPIAEQPEDGLFILSGLGSRGLMMAPLLGEALVCKALGKPSPLDISTQDRFGLS